MFTRYGGKQLNNQDINGRLMNDINNDINNDYPEIFYKMQPYIMMMCDRLDRYYQDNMPGQEMMDQITTEYFNDIIEMYPELLEYARNYENNRNAQPPQPTQPPQPAQPMQPGQPIPMMPAAPRTGQPGVPQPQRFNQQTAPAMSYKTEAVNNPRVYRRGFRRRGLLRDIFDILFLHEYNRRRRRYY